MRFVKAKFCMFRMKESGTRTTNCMRQHAIKDGVSTVGNKYLASSRTFVPTKMKYVRQMPHCCSTIVVRITITPR